jgi:hypothetical protein
VSAREIFIELIDMLVEARIRRGVERRDIFGGSRETIRAFTRGMPSREVAIELKTAMHRNAERARRWEPNDVFDMDALALAVPYCHAVVTEKHAATVLTNAKIDRRMNTVICRDLDAFATWLDSWT